MKSKELISSLAGMCCCCCGESPHSYSSSFALCTFACWLSNPEGIGLAIQLAGRSYASRGAVLRLPLLNRFPRPLPLDLPSLT